MIDDADDADETERAEAAALAAALDDEPREPREASEQAPPDDALATALLMRHASERGDHAELSAERAEAILSDVLREPVRSLQPMAKVVRLWPVGALLAAAAAGMLIVRSAQPASESAEAVRTATPAAAPVAAAAAARIPAPGVIPQASASLLAAQSALLQQSLATGASGSAAGESEAALRYEIELRAYRGELFRALHAAYPGKLGLLEPALQRQLRARRLR